MDKIHQEVEKIAVEIGPRAAGTAGEAKTKDFIESRLREEGIPPQVDPFLSPKSYSYHYGLLYVLGALGAFLLVTHRPFLGLVLGVVLVILFYLENVTKISLGGFFPQGLSHNVSGLLPATGVPSRSVLLVSHYDSSRSAINFSPRWVRNFRKSFLLSFYALVSLPVLSLLFLATGARVFLDLAFLPGIVLALAAVSLIHRELKGEVTPGANDNASGVAVLLSVGRELKTNPLERTEVRLLFTGAEEAGLVGMTAFLRKYPGLARRSYIVNVDSVGAGKLAYLRSEGMMRLLGADHYLAAKAFEVAREHPEWGVSPRDFRLVSTDATAALARGYSAMTLMALDEEGMIPNWHWRDDIQGINWNTIDTARSFLAEMLRKIEAEA